MQARFPSPKKQQKHFLFTVAPSLPTGGAITSKSLVSSNINSLSFMHRKQKLTLLQAGNMDSKLPSSHLMSATLRESVMVCGFLNGVGDGGGGEGFPSDKE